MKWRDKRSIIIIFVYLVINAFIIQLSFTQKHVPFGTKKDKTSVAPDFTEIENLDYFHLKDGVPQLSLAAIKMRSQGEEFAEFDEPKGVYNYQQKDKTIRYQALEGNYKKQKEILTLDGKVKMTTDDAEYIADHFKYYFKKDLIVGKENVKVTGDDLKSKDHFVIEALSMRAYPQKQHSSFKGNVQGSLIRKKNYEGGMTFSSNEMEMDGVKSLAQLRGDVVMKRAGYLITSGKGDIFLENFNKSLKYFVFNDDVKVTQTIKTPTGNTQRRAFSERLEGFAREEKMILSGAPRVEMGTDVVKGYRITIREDIDLIEVDDAMSDMQMKKKEQKNKELKE